ncbi:MAG: AcrB/AcrD/AcrF family protein [Alphaproteobacteria bacterium]|nr:AcrB/AcrD/AcrF family protein [Alphaproteobacteria bacterium]MBV9371891.1 AcrB/AcrD/AcrF family protein [Alphaproteobacteria bacterium]MBV9902277.1 AcrB/AcrD/AcrF family protein [Alphaproteobacteria bacterium]
MEELDRLEKHWRWWLLLFWLCAAAALIYAKWSAIRSFGLGDTDDNMRIMEVRAWLAGQPWYDLRQYRLNPPFGADIHWSRLVDLPIAGLKLGLTPLLGGAGAEKVAVTVAPLLPMAVAMAAVAAVARRLLAPSAFALAIAVLLCAQSPRAMWAPLRIDHHGWQLAFLACALAGLTDPKRARGGLILGLSTALSVVIGLEMLLYLALAGGLAVLMWVRDRGEARRLLTYGASLAGGTAAGYLLFASWANRAPMCDALSPVWLSALSGAGAVAILLALLPLRSWPLRLGAAAVGGVVVGAAFALAWPHCLGRLENVSPEATRLWLVNVREARPIYLHGLQTVVIVCALPIMGLIGYATMLWRSRRDPERLMLWGLVAAPALLAALLLLWQARAGPAAQLLAVPGATGLAWVLLPWTFGNRFMLVRVVGTVGAFLLVSGLLAQQVASWVPQPARPAMKTVKRADGLCWSLWGLHPVALVPKGYVLTHVDLGPRLIAVTHHDAVAGPYHRNGRDIVDVMLAFRSTPEYAHQVIERRGIDYVLVCPSMSETTIYSTQAKNGFYMQLIRGQVPDWLEPVPLPKASPFRMWRVRR